MRRGWLFLLFCSVSLLLYAPSLRGAFLFDDVNLARSSLIHITSLSELGRVVFFDGLPRRFGWASFALNYYFGGLTPFGYHLVNVVLHGLNAFLLFLVCQRLLGVSLIERKLQAEAELAAALGAGLWMVHTVQTQSVSYVYQRFTCLGATFYLLSIDLYLRARVEASARRWLFYVLSVLAGVGAFGTKENTATLPLFLLLIDWQLMRRPGTSTNKRFAAVAGLLLVFVVLCLYYLGPHFVSMIQGEYQRRGFTLMERLLTEARVFAYYASLLVFPHPSRLRLDYDFPLSRSLWSPSATFFCVAALLLILVFAFIRREKNRLFSFALVWFLGHLAIESTLIPLDLVNEHRLYLPSMIPIVFATGLVVGAFRQRAARAVVWMLLCSVAVSWSFWTLQRNRLWADRVAFWQDNARKSPEKPRVHFQLAKAYMEAGEWDEARRSLEHALGLDPDDVDARTTLANVYIDHFRDYGEARTLLVRVLEEQPSNTYALVGMGVIHLRRKELDRAIDTFERVLEIEPSNPAALVDLASAHFNGKDYEKVVEVTRRGIAYWPGNAHLHALMGAALAELGREWEAQEALEKALRLDGANTLARRYLGRN